MEKQRKRPQRKPFPTTTTTTAAATTTTKPQQPTVQQRSKTQQRQVQYQHIGTRPGVHEVSVLFGQLRDGQQQQQQQQQQKQ